jgi:hypothetical protein
MRCPVCRAENTSGAQCRRCRADLSLLFALEDQRAHLLAAAQAAISCAEGGEALRLAEAARQLRDGGDVGRLRALGHLLQRDFAGAWQTYAAPRPAPSAQS